ncbi:hypothetical protein AGABI2DRAFT_65309, partial [Agaricus bisporus var. bisporus H97]|uniref:hypothetical protein n=1 Tax=Agaricus bisporus var. bisporus (strain H97 / ATCC MYA-4626 / FGSC 10389) TaxID=936046 RepID=UPI00029F58AE
FECRLIGPSGSGKSHFMDLLTQQPGLRVGHSLGSTTTRISAVRVKHPYYGDRVVVVDTPGFDNATRSSAQVFNMTNNWLRKTYKKNYKINGLIYLHRITDNRMTNPLENFHIFRDLCEDFAMTQIVLVSTMWDELVVLDDGSMREKELRECFWKPFIDKGSRIDRLLNSHDSREAWRIVDQLIRQNEARSIKKLQRDLEDLGESLLELCSGRGLQSSLERALARQREAVRQVLAQKRRPDDPAIIKKLMKEYNKSEEQTRKALEDIRKAKVVMGSEILNVFCGKETHAVGVFSL